MAAFARMTVEDSRKLLPAEFYPSWVVFSERQKLSFFFPISLLLLADAYLCMYLLTKFLPFVELVEIKIKL